VRLGGSATNFSKQVLESVAERDRIRTRQSCVLEWFNRQFRIRGGKGFGHGTGGGRMYTQGPRHNLKSVAHTAPHEDLIV